MNPSRGMTAQEAWGTNEDGIVGDGYKEGSGWEAGAGEPKCGWATGYKDCQVAGCRFPVGCCVVVERERGEQ